MPLRSRRVDVTESQKISSRKSSLAQGRQAPLATGACGEHTGGVNDDEEQDAPFTLPVPEIFWSFETEAPIRNCLVCGRDLIESDEHYLIEKAFSRAEVVFEYGLCLACHTRLVGELSKKSLKLIQNYFEEQVDLEARRERILGEFDGTELPWVSRCLFTGKSVVESDEYQILGMCRGEELLLGDLPHAISGEAIEAIMNLLSDKTRGFLDDFTGRYFGAPTGADLPRILPL